MQIMIVYTLLRYIGLALTLTVLLSCNSSSSSSSDPVLPIERYTDDSTNVQLVLPSGFVAQENNTVTNSTYKYGEKTISITSSTDISTASLGNNDTKICNIPAFTHHIGTRTITDEQGTISIDVNTYTSNVVVSETLYNITYLYGNTSNHEEVYIQFRGSCPDLSGD